jgi:hypothetical protein
MDALKTCSEVRAVAADGSSDIPAHLQELYERWIKSLDEEQAVVLKQLLREYADVFAKDDHDLGLLCGVKHRIDTEDAKPIKQPMRRTPLGFEGEEERHLTSMLRNSSLDDTTAVAQAHQ